MRNKKSEGPAGIKGLVRPNVLALTPYDAKEIPCLVKLDANESPYARPVGPGILKAVKTNRYPDPLAIDVRRAFAKRMLPARTGMDWVLHGNGSDELIYNLICTFGGPVVYPTPTFSMYGKIAQALGVKSAGVPLAGDFEIDDAGMLRALAGGKTGIAFISRPNNPTGNSFSEEKILRIIGRAQGIVVVDEAYQPFSGKKSFLRHLGRHKNLAVLMTLSKVGFAALRVGFLAARPELIAEVNKVRLPFNVNSYSQAAAADALRNFGRLEGGIRKVVSERKRVFEALSRMKGVTPYPSDANFILFRVPLDPAKVYRLALKEGVLLRNLSPAVDGCLRVTIGTRKENSAFIESMKKMTSGGQAVKKSGTSGEKRVRK